MTQIVAERPPVIESEGLRILIRTKLAEGRLPQTLPLRVSGGRGNGESCNACEETITKDEYVIGGTYPAEGTELLQLHVKCFWLWDSVRLRPPAQ